MNVLITEEASLPVALMQFVKTCLAHMTVSVHLVLLEIHSAAVKVSTNSFFFFFLRLVYIKILMQIINNHCSDDIMFFQLNF